MGEHFVLALGYIKIQMHIKDICTKHWHLTVKDEVEDGDTYTYLIYTYSKFIQAYLEGNEFEFLE
jgi:hypothetical protein